MDNIIEFIQEKLEQHLALKPDEYEDLTGVIVESLEKDDGDDWFEGFNLNQRLELPEDFRVLVLPIVIKKYFEKYKLECTAYLFYETSNLENVFMVLVQDEFSSLIKYSLIY